MTDGTGQVTAESTITTVPAVSVVSRCLYVFLDEGGNLDFSSKGTRFFTLSAVTQRRPFLMDSRLYELRLDLLESGLDLQRFHAAEDRQVVRNRVFQIIQSEIASLRLDTIVVEKAKTNSTLQPVEYFYPRLLGHVLRQILAAVPSSGYDEVLVITDSLPVNSKRKAIEKGIKLTLANMLPSEVKYRVLHHPSYSSMGLQVADYCNWAVFRKWESADPRSYALIQPALQTEFEIHERAKNDRLD